MYTEYLQLLTSPWWGRILPPSGWMAIFTINFDPVRVAYRLLYNWSNPSGIVTAVHAARAQGELVAFSGNNLNSKFTHVTCRGLFNVVDVGLGMPIRDSLKLVRSKGSISGHFTGGMALPNSVLFPCGLVGHHFTGQWVPIHYPLRGKDKRLWQLCTCI